MQEPKTLGEAHPLRPADDPAWHLRVALLKGTEPFPAPFRPARQQGVVAITDPLWNDFVDLIPQIYSSEEDRGFMAGPLDLLASRVRRRNFSRDTNNPFKLTSSALLDMSRFVGDDLARLPAGAADVAYALVRLNDEHGIQPYHNLTVAAEGAADAIGSHRQADPPISDDHIDDVAAQILAGGSSFENAFVDRASRWLVLLHTAAVFAEMEMDWKEEHLQTKWPQLSNEFWKQQTEMLRSQAALLMTEPVALLSWLHWSARVLLNPPPVAIDWNAHPWPWDDP